MIKAIYALSAVAVVLAGIAFLPGFTPQVEASVPVALSRGDRLDIRPVGGTCSQQAWPNLDASCLRNAGTKTVVGAARVINAN